MTFDGLTWNVLLERFTLGVFFFVRIGGMMASAPIFANQGIPSTVKILLTALLAGIMTTSYSEGQPTIEFELWALIPIIFKELLVGVILGTCMNMLFYAVRLAGGILDVDLGFQTSQLYNPDAGSPTLLGELKTLVMTMVFLIVNGHHYLIESIVSTGKFIPIGGFTFPEISLQLFTGIVTAMFVIGIKIAAPVLIALFLTNFALALLSKTAPQLNIFVLSFQFKIAVGLLVLMFSVPVLVYVSKNAVEAFEQHTTEILESLKPKST